MKHWIGVASRDHVRRGVAGGFAQLGHGKRAPLARMKRGDWLVYYSPRTQLEGGEPVQAFTALGQVTGEIEQVTLEGWCPYRRAVHYTLETHEAPIRPLLEHLSFITDLQRWGYPFHRGHFAVSEPDFQLIARAMGVTGFAPH
jgi:hypothetical protein